MPDTLIPTQFRLAVGSVEVVSGLAVLAGETSEEENDWICEHCGKILIPSQQKQED